MNLPIYISGDVCYDWFMDNNIIINPSAAIILATIDTLPIDEAGFVWTAAGDHHITLGISVQVAFELALQDLADLKAFAIQDELDYIDAHMG